jgi:2,3-bisphosphoglycerate-independent phosphoglycerate mutase
MKYIVIIPDGAADIPLKELGNKTPFAAARIPSMDSLASQGLIGTVRTVPADMTPGSDVAIMSLLGNNPQTYYTGRAPIEAAARRIKLKQNEWAFRCNLVTIIDNIMKDHSAGNISSGEAKVLIEEVNKRLGTETIRFYSGVSYRNLMTFKGDFEGHTTPPHDILDKEVKEYLPSGTKADLLQSLITASQTFLPDHDINQKRIKESKNPATSIWFWGEGKATVFESFKKKYGLDGAIIAAVDLVRGIGILMGWDVIEVPGITGYIDTNYAGKGSYAIRALDRYDILCIHIEATDEASHAGSAQEKVKAIEQIDTHILSPLINHFRTTGSEWRVLIMPDHPTPCTLRTHTHDPVPFIIAGSNIRWNGGRSFTEAEAESTGLTIEQGYTIMDFFLSSNPGS